MIKDQPMKSVQQHQEECHCRPQSKSNKNGEQGGSIEAERSEQWLN